MVPALALSLTKQPELGQASKAELLSVVHDKTKHDQQCGAVTSYESSLPLMLQTVLYLTPVAVPFDL